MLLLQLRCNIFSSVCFLFLIPVLSIFFYAPGTWLWFSTSTKWRAVNKSEYENSKHHITKGAIFLSVLVFRTFLFFASHSAGSLALCSGISFISPYFFFLMIYWQLMGADVFVSVYFRYYFLASCWHGSYTMASRLRCVQYSSPGQRHWVNNGSTLALGHCTVWFCIHIHLVCECEMRATCVCSASVTSEVIWLCLNL